MDLKTVNASSYLKSYNSLICFTNALLRSTNTLTIQKKMGPSSSKSARH